MSTYKLTYFNVKARGETIRFIFAVSGQEYEDVRIDTDLPEEWLKMKQTLPFEQLPVLDVDGRRLAQSGAIKRFLARRFNLYGDNEFEAVEIDQVCEALVDLGLDIRKYVWEKEEERKEQIRQEFVESGVKKHFKFLANLLDKNGGDGFFVGKRISLADLEVANYMKDMVPRVPGLDVLEPKLVAHMERILAIPELAAWIKKRPYTPK